MVAIQIKYASGWETYGEVCDPNAAHFALLALRRRYPRYRFRARAQKAN